MKVACVCFLAALPLMEGCVRGKWSNYKKKRKACQRAEMLSLEPKLAWTFGSGCGGIAEGAY